MVAQKLAARLARSNFFSLSLYFASHLVSFAAVIWVVTQRLVGTGEECVTTQIMAA